MSQKTNKLYSLFSNSFLYSFSQRIMSGTSFRGKIVSKYITKKNVNVLDIGCGPAEILDSLPIVKYFGYDINPAYISFAKKKYGKTGNFYCKKFSDKELKKIPRFDHVLLLGILHHLNNREIEKLIPKIKKVLKKRGNIIAIDPILDKKQNFIAKFIIKKDRGDNVRNKKEYLKNMNKYFKKIKSKIYYQKFIPYTWFVMICKN